ncbi:MAG: PAS domain S-box protein [Bacteroidales bacterium]|nr:PAS domain S-box protein [Bacteroidales bacterium]
MSSPVPKPETRNLKHETNKDMNKQNLNLLILEDNPDHAELMVKELKKEGFIFEWERVETKKSFKKALAKKPDIILSDYNLPSFDGMTAIRLQQQTAPDIPLILVSGTIGEELAVECMKAGAIDYVLKDKLSRLGPVIKRAIKEAEEHIKRKQAEEEIVKLSKIVETTPEAIIITDIQGKIEYVNPGLLAMSGFEDDSKIIGQSLFLFSDEDGKKRLHEEVIPELLSGGKWKGEIPVKRKDGSVFPAEMICSIILDEKEQSKYLLSNYNDITERKQAEKALQESNKRLNIILNHLHAGVVIIDTENYIIIDINPMAAQMIGAPKEEIIGKICHKYICPVEIGKCPIIDLGQNMDNSEREIINTKGEIISIQKTVIPITLNGRNCLLENFIDITKLKNAEKELKKRLRELEVYYKATLGREGRIIELKHEINRLLEQFGEKRKYGV